LDYVENPNLKENINPNLKENLNLKEDGQKVDANIKP
jgi:hypothetical protein